MHQKCRKKRLDAKKEKKCKRKKKRSDATKNKATWLSVARSLVKEMLVPEVTLNFVFLQ